MKHYGTNRELTAETTRRILDFLFDLKIIASRNNVLPVPVARGGAVVSFRPGSRSGRPDIEGIYTPRGTHFGIALCIEVKTGPDKLRDIQQSYLAQASAAGAVVLVVKDFDDFVQKWINVEKSFEYLWTTSGKSTKPHD